MNGSTLGIIVAGFGAYLIAMSALGRSLARCRVRTSAAFDPSALCTPPAAAAPDSERRDPVAS